MRLTILPEIQADRILSVFECVNRAPRLLRLIRSSIEKRY